MLFEHPSVTALVDHLLDDGGNGAGPSGAGNGAAPPDEHRRPPVDRIGAADADDIATALEARLDRLGGRG